MSMPLSDITSIVPESIEIPEEEPHKIVILELIARQHHRRALSFTCRITGPELGTSQFASTGVSAFTYGSLFLSRACYVRLLTDIEWQPTPAQAIIIIQAIGYLEDYSWCDTCGLPKGIWCNDPDALPL